MPNRFKDLAGSVAVRRPDEPLARVLVDMARRLLRVRAGA
jgi:hypothetical protein